MLGQRMSAVEHNFALTREKHMQVWAELAVNQAISWVNVPSLWAFLACRIATHQDVSHRNQRLKQDTGQTKIQNPIQSFLSGVTWPIPLWHFLNKDPSLPAALASIYRICLSLLVVHWQEVTTCKLNLDQEREALQLQEFYFPLKVIECHSSSHIGLPNKIPIARFPHVSSLSFPYADEDRAHRTDAFAKQLSECEAFGNKTVSDQFWRAGIQRLWWVDSLSRKKSE